MPIVSRKVIKLNDTSYKPVEGKTERLFRDFRKEEGHLEQDLMDINIKPYEVPEKYKNYANPQSVRKDSLKSLPFIKEDEVLRISRDILAILRNPNLVAEYLKPLDTKLGEEMAAAYNVGENKYKDEELPDSVITARGFFMPGPPPPNYKPRSQDRLLDDLLLKREAAAEINLEGFTPKFVGFVNSEKANKLVSEGHVFAEDVQVKNLLLHGKYSHRLDFEIIRSAAAMGKLDLSVKADDGTVRNLTQKELLQMMITATILPGNISVWNKLIDILGDVLDSANAAPNEARKFSDLFTGPSFIDLMRKKLFSAPNYSFSSQAPESLNSLILCFGKDVGLENLQHYMLNSHYKEAAQMVGRAREIIAKEESKLDSLATRLFKAINQSRHKIAPEDVEPIKTDFNNLYIHCIKSLAKLGVINPGELVASPLTLEPKDASKSKKYQQFQEAYEADPKIKKKEKKGPEDRIVAVTLDEYIEKKKVKTDAQKPSPEMSPNMFGSLLRYVGISR